MQYAQSAHAHAGERGVRQVHGVFDVAVEQIVIEFPGRHLGAAVLALRRAGPQVGHGDDVGRAQNSLVREVRDIFCDLAAIQRAGHGLVVHDLGPGFIDDAHAALHLGKGLVAQHVVGLLRVGDVHTDVVGMLIDGVHILGLAHLAREAPGRVHGHEGVVAVDLHAELQSDVRDQRAHGAQTQHAQGLAQQLGPGKGGLALFHQGGDVVPPVGDGAHPVDGADHVAGRHDQGRDFLLLDRLGIGAGAVEDHDALFGAVLDGDVVIARAGSRDGQQLGVEFLAVQIGAADQQTVGRFHIRAHLAAPLFQGAGAVLGDGVHGFDLKHGVLQTPSYTRPAPWRPPRAWRCTGRRGCPPSACGP